MSSAQTVKTWPESDQSTSAAQLCSDLDLADAESAQITNFITRNGFTVVKISENDWMVTSE